MIQSFVGRRGPWHRELRRQAFAETVRAAQGLRGTKGRPKQRHRNPRVERDPTHASHDRPPRRRADGESGVLEQPT